MAKARRHGRTKAEEKARRPAHSAVAAITCSRLTVGYLEREVIGRKTVGTMPRPEAAVSAKQESRKATAKARECKVPVSQPKEKAKASKASSDMLQLNRRLFRRP